MEKSFETPNELAARVGVPVANIRRLIREGELEHIYLTPARRNAKIPNGAWERYLDRSIIKPSPTTIDDSKGTSPMQ